MTGPAPEVTRQQITDLSLPRAMVAVAVLIVAAHSVPWLRDPALTRAEHHHAPTSTRTTDTMMVEDR